MVKKKHILFIVENNQAVEDYRVWSEVLAAKEFGYDVTVISPAKRNSRKFSEVDGIPVYGHYWPIEASGKFGFIFEYLNAIFWELLLSVIIFINKPFHYIHAANPPDHIFIIALIYKIFGTKFIFDHHDICPENYLAKFGRRDLFYRMLLLMEKLTFKTADIVISTNESYKKIATNRGNKDAQEVFVVRNGPDLAKIPPTKPNKNLKNSFKYLVVYVGEIGNQEGIDNLLKTVEYIVYEKKLRNIRFVVIGKGPYLEKLIEMSKETEDRSIFEIHRIYSL